MTGKGFKRIGNKISNTENDLSAAQKRAGDAASNDTNSWHDNADYESAVAETKLQDRRLSDLHNLLRDIEILEYPKIISKKVEYGTRVIFLRDNKRFDLNIVGYGDTEFDKDDRILYESPLAKALLGHKIGDKFKETVNEKLYEFVIKTVLPITDPELI